MGAMASQITSLTIIYSIVYSGADQSSSRQRHYFFLTQHNEPTNENQKDDFHISTPHLVCCSGDDVTIGCVKLGETSQLIMLRFT